MSFPIVGLLLRGPRQEKLRRRLAGLIRVSTYLTVVGGLSSLWLARAASAGVEEAVQHFGESVLRQLGPEIIGQTQHILVNGQSVFFSSQVTGRPFASTLDDLTRHCESLDNPALSAVADLPASAKARAQELLAELGNPRRLGIDRQETEDHTMGQVACIAHPQDKATLEQVLDRAFRFLDSGDLSEIGDARYFLARKVTDASTHVIAIWTEGRFDIAGMFPAEGDAPGSDSAVLPRPPAARRTFSAILPDRPYAVRVYESRQSREVILNHYDEVMTQSGWVERPTSDGDELRVLTRAFSRQDTVVFVILDAEREGETPVTLVEVGGNGSVHATVEERP